MIHVGSHLRVFDGLESHKLKFAEVGKKLHVSVGGILYS
jgi:hypothetical protein